MKWLLRLTLAFAALIIGAALWLLGTESGLRFALGFAPPQLAVENPRGALAREIRADRVAWEGIEARKVALEVNLLALLANTVSVNFARIDSLTVSLQKGKGEEKTAFVLPLRIKVSDAEVRSLVFEGYEINDLKLDFDGGPLGQELSAAFRAAGARAKVKAAFDARFRPKELDAALESLNLAVIDPELPQTALRARLQARADEKLASGTLTLENPDAGPLDAERLPVARIESKFSTDFSSLSFDNLRAALHGSGVLEGSARLRGQSAQLDLKVRDVDLRSLRSSLARTRLGGSVSATLEPERQSVKGTLAQDDMSLTADAERRGDVVEVRALEARAAGGEARGHGRITLGKAPGFEADLRLARFDPSRFGDYPKGNLNGNVKGHGALDGAVRGAFSWDIADSTLLEQPFASRGRASLAGERVADADAWATLGANRATAKGAFGAPRDALAWTLDLPDLSAFHEAVGGQVRAQGSAKGRWQKPQVELTASGKAIRVPGLDFDTVSLKASGTLDAHQGEVKARNADLDLSARLRGGWSRGAWRGEVLAFENAGLHPLALQAPAPLEIAPGRFSLERFNATLAGGRVALESLRWQDGRLSSTGAFAAMPAESILRFTDLKDVLHGNLTLDGDWSLLSSPRLNGRLSVRRSGGDLALAGPPEVQLALSRATLDARFTDGRVAAALDLASRLGSVRAEGEAQGLTPDAAAQYTVQLELAELRLLTEPLWTQVRVGGRLGATLRGAGTLGKPQLTGTLRGDGLTFEAYAQGIQLGGGRLRAELEGDRLRITEALIGAGDGRFSVRGTLPLRPAEGGTELEWQADKFRVLNRPDSRLIVSGKGTAGFDGRKLALAGELRADSGHFEARGSSLPEPSDDVVVLGQERPGRDRRAPLPVNLDLQLDLGEQFTVQGFGFNGGVAGRLHVVTDSAGRLLAQGRVRAVHARFYAFGQRLEVDPGVLIFDGPLDRPALDITAWRRPQQVAAGVHVTGTIEAPNVEIVSNPPVSDADKLSWLVLGRAPTTATGTDLAILQAASGALLSMRDRGEPGIQRRIASQFGLDELTIRSSSDIGARGATDTSNVFALGKRLSDRLYLSFEQALGATAEYLVKLDYSLTQRVSLRGQTGTTSGVGVFYRYAWD